MCQLAEPKSSPSPTPTVVLSYEVRETTLYKNDKKKYKVDNKAVSSNPEPMQVRPLTAMQVLMNICRGMIPSPFRIQH